jgi:hypothetical protein
MRVQMKRGARGLLYRMGFLQQRFENLAIDHGKCLERFIFPSYGH